jgi:hypothetical protein
MTVKAVLKETGPESFGESIKKNETAMPTGSIITENTRAGRKEKARKKTGTGTKINIKTMSDKTPPKEGFYYLFHLKAF